MFAVALAALVQAQAAPLFVPANTGYLTPKAESLEFDIAGPVKGTLGLADRLTWYGDFAKAGSLSVVVQGTLTAGDRYELSVGGVRRQATAEATKITFGDFRFKQTGYVPVQLRLLKGSGVATLTGLNLTGTATEGVHLNLKERRNAASVHFRYPQADGKNVTAFYNAIRVSAVPTASYYMACGFARGYFGIQVNDEKERRVIFSIWDSGDEAVSRDKVADVDRVTLIAKGNEVFSGDFGNEGTGGHSHLKFNWREKDVHRFLVTAKPEGTHTSYAGYYYFNNLRRWGLISAWKAPKDGQYLRGLYSFNENFWGSNGQKMRKAKFGPGWIRTEDGTWEELTEARFSHDATGKEDRKDYGASVAGSGFELWNGGFRRGTAVYGQAFTRRPTRRLPAELKNFRY